MKLLTIAGLVLFTACDSHKPVITREHIQEIRKNASFETYDYEEHSFKDANEHDLITALGLRDMGLHQLPPLPKGFTDDLPTSFIFHDKWPQCIHQIREHGRCVLSLLSKSYQTNYVLSQVESLITSCDTKDLGCSAGNLEISWDWCC
jgi:hypothetical protein